MYWVCPCRSVLHGPPPSPRGVRSGPGVGSANRNSFSNACSRGDDVSERTGERRLPVTRGAAGGAGAVPARVAAATATRRTTIPVPPSGVPPQKAGRRNSRRNRKNSQRGGGGGNGGGNGNRRYKHKTPDEKFGGREPRDVTPSGEVDWRLEPFDLFCAYYLGITPDQSLQEADQPA